MKSSSSSVLSLTAYLVLISFLSCHTNLNEGSVTSEEALGEMLFFDPVLSRDSSVSCGTCHKPEFAFADNVAFSRGIYGRLATRNTPSAMNQGNRNFYFWDGRAESLQEQAFAPMEDHFEMDFPASLAVRRLSRNGFYRKSFMDIYGKMPAKDLIGRAISAYERTLESGTTVFDKYQNGEDTNAMSASAKRGLAVFNGKGKCFDCHFGVDFTGNDRFKNIGLYNGKDLSDEGRFKITGQSADLGAFKVPGLRNVALTAPYMHNGKFKTLMNVIDYYDEPDKVVNNPINRDSLLRMPLGLTETEKKDLENFLLSLTEERYLRN